MTVTVGFCEAEIILPIPSFSPSPPSSIQYFIGVTPITSIISVTDSSTTASIQADIDNDPVYRASGTTITVVVGFEIVTATIQKASATQITDPARGVSNIGGDVTSDSSAFTCNLSPTKKKKNRVAPLRCPDEIIFNAQISHPQVKYCNNNIYNFYGIDEQGLLHYINSVSNISQRNTGNWWAINI